MPERGRNLEMPRAICAFQPENYTAGGIPAGPQLS
jgi:hypothetical protein